MDEMNKIAASALTGAKEPSEKWGQHGIETPFEAERKRLENVFTYHAPKGTQPVKYEEIRNSALNYSLRLIELCPASRERSLALTKLEEVVFWANAAIARNE